MTTRITRINDNQTLVIKQDGQRDLCILTDNSIIISIGNLLYLLKFLIDNKFIDAKTLKGILDETT